MIYNQTKYNDKWKTMKLNELGNFSRGKSKHRPRNDKKLFEGGGYPLVQTGEIKESNLYVNKHNSEYNEFGLAQSKLWDKDTLCITIAANIAETAILAYPMCFPDSIVGFNANKEVSSELFMHYIFTYIKQAIQKSASGSIQDNINIDYLEHLDFKIPNKNIQDKITNVLYNIDKKIEVNNKVIDKLEKLSKTIYNYWFVQYEFPNENGKPYKSSCGKMIWNEELKKDIPEGWKVIKTSERFKYEKGIEPGAEQYIEGKRDGYIKFYRVGDVDDSGSIYIPKGFEKDARCTPYELLVTFDGTVGKVGIGLNGVYSTGMKKISDKESEIDVSVIWALFNSDRFQNIIQKYATGSNILHASSSIDYLDFEYNKEIFNKFQKIVKPIYCKIIKNRLENQELKYLRDYLLPLLMNGQVGFKN